MMSSYTEKQVLSIAQECSEFEHFINAMNYGSSLLNISPDSCQRRCPDCINWLGASCEIFQRELTRWQ